VTRVQELTFFFKP